MEFLGYKNIYSYKWLIFSSKKRFDFFIVSIYNYSECDRLSNIFKYYQIKKTFYPKIYFILNSNTQNSKLVCKLNNLFVFMNIPD